MKRMLNILKRCNTNLYARLLNVN